MIDPADVTACLVTRGDQPDMMEQIVQSLIFDRVVIWDNSERDDHKTAGRYFAQLEAATPFCYFQDDDCLVPPKTQHALCEAHIEGAHCTANWGHGETPAGYDDLPLVCGGGIVDTPAPWAAIERWSEHFPTDEAFDYYCDFAVGVLYPSFVHVYLPFHIELAIAQDPSRLCNQPWARGMKASITARARAIRDGTL